MSIDVQSTIVDFEGDQLVVYAEASMAFKLDEKPYDDGPPAYLSKFEVSPATFGAPVPSSRDGRGSVPELPGLAVLPYEYAQRKKHMRSMHLRYFNLYTDNQNNLLFKGCGLADKEFLWSSRLKECADSAEIKKAYNTIKEASIAKKSGTERVPKD